LLCAPKRIQRPRSTHSGATAQSAPITGPKVPRCSLARTRESTASPTRRQLAYAQAHADEFLANDLAAAASAVGEPALARAVLRRIRGHRLGTEDAARAFALSSALRPLVAYAR